MQHKDICPQSGVEMRIVDESKITDVSCDYMTIDSEYNYLFVDGYLLSKDNESKWVYSDKGWVSFYCVIEGVMYLTEEAYSNSCLNTLTKELFKPDNLDFINRRKTGKTENQEQLEALRKKIGIFHKSYSLPISVKTVKERKYFKQLEDNWQSNKNQVIKKLQEVLNQEKRTNPLVSNELVEVQECEFPNGVALLSSMDYINEPIGLELDESIKDTINLQHQIQEEIFNSTKIDKKYFKPEPIPMPNFTYPYLDHIDYKRRKPSFWSRVLNFFRR